MKKAFTLVEIMIVVAIVGIIIAIAVPAFIRARENARGRACQENLFKIESAKEQYATEMKLPQGSVADFSRLVSGSTGYLRNTPKCPGGGTYTPGVVGTAASCDYTGDTGYIEHTLPSSGS